jgi:hypothetical protein
MNRRDSALIESAAWVALALVVLAVLAARFA